MPSGASTVRHISIDRIRDAARALAGVAVRTPLVPVGPVSDEGPELYLKLETLQPIGSFKLRGAYNALRRLPPQALADGVWTVSAGNAAQGVALAARLLGARCTVLVVDTAPATKLAAIERLGATIVKASYEDCWHAVETRRASGMHGTFVHPFDDDDFIAGNGTIGLEIAEDLPDVDAVVAPVGGGGLVAGLASALSALAPRARVYAAEPETAAPLSVSLAAGGPRSFPGWRASFVDGAGGRSVLPSMWPLLASRIAGSIVVSLDQIAEAMRWTAERVHVIAEGAAGCAVAAARSGRAGRGKVVAVVSGGNIDLPQFARLVGACGAAPAEPRAAHR
jgi:threonine dehydratase